MIEQLFGSKTRVKLLKLFFSNPNRSFYVREITRRIEEQINSVRRELANLLSLGLITSESANNKLYYEVNQQYEHFDALQSIFSESVKEKDDPEGVKSSSPKDTKKTSKKTNAQTKNVDDQVELPEAQRWARAGNIAGIAYSGVYTRDDSAGVDIVIIGDVVASKVDSVVAELEKEKNKDLRYAVIELKEWRYRGQVSDKFWLQVMAVKKQIVLDKDSVFTNK